MLLLRGGGSLAMNFAATGRAKSKQSGANGEIEKLKTAANPFMPTVLIATTLRLWA
jgi:hypothetical protein